MKIILIALTFLSFNTQAQVQDTLTGPHGGRIKITQGYRIETVGCDNYLEVYLFNEDSDPIFNNGISGDVKFFYDKKTSSASLKAYGIDGFTCRIESAEFSHYVVTMNLLDRMIISASFNECVIPKR